MTIKDFGSFKTACSITSECDVEGNCKMLIEKQNGTYSDDEIVCSKKNCPLIKYKVEE